MKLPKAKESKPFEMCPPGNHVAVCFAVIDLGTHERKFLDGKKMLRLVRITWEIPQERMSDGRPFSVKNDYTLSRSERSTLRKHLDSWRGRKFTDEQYDDFDLQTVIGKGCMLQVTHSEKEDRTYVNVQSIACLPKGMKVDATENEHIYLSLEPDRYDPGVFANLHEKTQEYISESPEWKALHGQAPSNKQRTVEDYAGTGAAEVAEEEDIPF